MPFLAVYKIEAITNDFNSITKKQLEAFGRTIGLELDKRHNKASLIAELESFTSSN